MHVPLHKRSIAVLRTASTLLHLPVFRAGVHKPQQPRARDQLRLAGSGLLPVEPSDKTDACLHEGSLLSYGPEGVEDLCPHPTGPPCLVRTGPLHFIERCLFFRANLVCGQAPRPRRLRVCVIPSDNWYLPRRHRSCKRRQMRTFPCQRRRSKRWQSPARCLIRDARSLLRGSRWLVFPRMDSFLFPLSSHSSRDVPRDGDKRTTPQNGATGIPAIGLTQNTSGKSQTQIFTTAPGDRPGAWLECLFSSESLLCPTRRLGVASSGGSAQTGVQEELGGLNDTSFPFLHAGARNGGGWSGFPRFEASSWHLFAYPTAAPRKLTMLTPTCRAISPDLHGRPCPHGPASYPHKVPRSDLHDANEQAKKS